MAMERAEIIGLGVAVAGHVVLIAILAFGLLASEEMIEKPQSIAVTLDGPGSPLPITGDIGDSLPEPSEEESAPAEEPDTSADDSAMAAKEAAAAEAEAEARRAEAAAKAANASAAEKARAKKLAAEAARKKREAAAAEAKRKKAREAAAKKKREAERKRKAEAEAERKRKAAEAARRKKDFENRMGKALGGGDNAPSAGAARKARATIGGQIPIRGCPSGIDVNKIVTRVTINLNRNGSIKSLTNISQSGRTASNAPQMAPTQRCILNSIRAAAPFSGLNAADYQSWKSIRIGFKAK